MSQNNQKLLAILTEIKGAHIVNLAMASEPKMNKRGNPLFGRVTKVQIQSCQFGYSYENAVNNRIGDPKHETFKAEQLSWGEWLVPNKIIAHNGNFYGRFYKMNNAKTEVIWLVDDRLATEEEVEIIRQYTPNRATSARQESVGLEENQVKPFDVRFDHVVYIAGDKMNYVNEELSAKVVAAIEQQESNDVLGRPCTAKAV